jgi:hypothetical protein
MKDKIVFLKNDKELAQKIVMLYQILFDFEKNKNKSKVDINYRRKNGKTI